MRCNYPNCDGGSATGYCHGDCRSQICKSCYGEGKRPFESTTCPACGGTGHQNQKPITRLEKANRMVTIYRRKCDEAAASDAPWALGNLRTYQNYLSKAVSEQCAASRGIAGCK